MLLYSFVTSKSNFVSFSWVFSEKFSFSTHSSIITSSSARINPLNCVLHQLRHPPTPVSQKSHISNIFFCCISMNIENKTVLKFNIPSQKRADGLWYKVNWKNEMNRNNLYPIDHWIYEIHCLMHFSFCHTTFY